MNWDTILSSSIAVMTGIIWYLTSQMLISSQETLKISKEIYNDGKRKDFDFHKGDTFLDGGSEFQRFFIINTGNVSLTFNLYSSDVIEGLSDKNNKINKKSFVLKNKTTPMDVIIVYISKGFIIKHKKKIPNLERMNNLVTIKPGESFEFYITISDSKNILGIYSYSGEDRYINQ